MTPTKGRAITALTVAVVAVLVLLSLNAPPPPVLPPARPGNLVWRITYDQCGHTSESTIPLTQGVDLADLTQGWETVDHHGDRIVASRREPGLCPEDRVYRHLRLESDMIAVYYGRPRADAVLSRVLPIDRSWLLPEDITRLEEGIVVVGDEGVSAYIEGLSD